MGINRQVPANWHKDGKTHVLIIKGDRFATFELDDGDYAEEKMRAALGCLEHNITCQN